MARVVVVGGGFGGLASAARLAKNGHEVTLLESGSEVGGALAPVTAEGFTWDGGPTSLLMPAVVRDLFRKSGRPLENELGAELEPLRILREHRFVDTSVLRLPGASRADQIAAFDDLGLGLGRRWAEYVDAQGVTWELLRQHFFEVPFDPSTAPREVADLLHTRDHLYKRLRKAFKDDRLAMVAGHPLVADGHDLRNVPSWMGVVSFLEQSFGAWQLPGGMARLRDLLVARLATRGVTTLVDTEARDVVVRDGRAAAVATRQGEVAADVVVCAVDPRRLPALAGFVERTMPAMPPVISYLGLEGAVPALEHETVIHGNPMIVIRPGGVAPDGMTAWTVHGRGKIAEDLLRVLARARIDVRENVVTRVDCSPLDLVKRWGGSPYGMLWQGRGTVKDRLGPTTPVPGVYAVGAHANPGAGLAYVGLSAAAAATAIGPV